MVVVFLTFSSAGCIGWFKPGGTSRSRRLYNYTLHPSGRYVLWDVKEIRKGIEECESALIYTHQVFSSLLVQVSELVVGFKYLLGMLAVHYVIYVLIRL